jgi:patatin-like phospholipase/acyl hydrolase
MTDVVLTSYDVRAQRPRLFRSAAVKAGTEGDREMAEVALAASCPPTYFPAVEIEGEDGEPMVLVDGGVFAKTPALIAYLEGVRLVRSSRRRFSGVEVVSVGTGSLGSRPELTLEEYSGRSWYRLAQAIFEAAQAGQSSVTEEVLGEVLGDRYWRFDLILDDDTAPAIDDASPEALAELERLGRGLVETHRADLERLAERLKKG